MREDEVLREHPVRLGEDLVVHEVVVGEGGGVGEELGVHGHLGEDQVAAVGTEERDLAGGLDLGAAVSGVDALAGIQHEDVGKGLVKVIDVAEGVEVQVEVVAVVGDVGLAERVGNSGLGEQSSLDGGKPRKEGIIPARGEREIVVGLRLEGEADVALDEGVHEVSSGKDGNKQQFHVDGLVEVDKFEALLLGEGGVVDLLGVLDLLVHVDLAVGVLHVQGQQELLGL